MSSFPDEKPPRVAFGMYKRFAIAGVLITLLTAGTVASAGLLEVKDLVSVIRDESAGHVIPGLKGALDDVPAGKPADDPRPGLRPALRRHQAGQPGALGHDDARAAGPVEGGHRGDEHPARPQGADPVPGGGIDTTKINAAYSYGGPALAVKTVRNLLHIPINHVVNVNFGGFQRAVNRLGCVYVDVDKRYYHSNAGLPVSAAVRRDQRPGGLPEAVRLEVAGLRALPPRRRRPRALGAPAGLPAPGQGPDRARAAVRRPQGAAEDLRALHRHRPALELGDPAPAQARLRVLGAPDPRGALPRRHRARLRDHHAQQPRADQAGVPARQGLQRARASSAAGRPSRRARRPSAAQAAPRPGCPPASSTTRRAARTSSRRPRRA